MVALESWQALRCCLLWRCCFLLQEWLHRSCLDQGISFDAPYFFFCFACLLLQQKHSCNSNTSLLLRCRSFCTASLLLLLPLCCHCCCPTQPLLFSAALCEQQQHSCNSNPTNQTAACLFVFANSNTTTTTMFCKCLSPCGNSPRNP